ncbi:hypothetical protein BP6252_13211 [Coleophoma cylindrospora]|uniref:NACHT domain-containing protein n=1 Tax=Coleophoma cylindrospora TaxID=1849047 RepID=A0A3D8QA70_9HELO|nr:hypothetical protein BP6252_13211 [Coleophoma cylindrospora]
MIAATIIYFVALLRLAATLFAEALGWAVPRLSSRWFSRRRSIAKPCLDGRKITYRVTRIPSVLDKQSFLTALASALSLDPSSVTLHSLATDLSSPGNVSDRVATISFALPTPTFIKDTAKDAKSARIVLRHRQAFPEATVYIDQNFGGFTPLSPIENDDVYEMDCIAIHGWGGHPFGSYRASQDKSYMWLRDDLAKKMPKVRVWLYGYGTSLSDNSTIEDVDTFADTLTHLLRTFRGRGDDLERAKPLIFIAHSLGGLVFKQAVVSMSNSANLIDQLNLQCIYGALFFGVPSRGLLAEDIREMVQDGPQRYILSLLDKGFGFRYKEKQHREFCKAFPYKTSKIIQFFETRQSPSLIQNKITKEWERSGPQKLFVTPESATCGRHWETGNNYHVNIETDHSGLVKFEQDDRVWYPKVKGVLEEFAGEAGHTIRARLLLQDPTDLTDEQNQCLESLRFPSMDKREKSVIAPASNTFSWIWDENIGFSKWIQNTEPIFWIQGKPGSGKSTLLVDTLKQCKQRHPRKLIIQYFFNSRGSEDEYSLDGFFRSTITQLLRRNRHAFQSVLPEFRKRMADLKKFGMRHISWDRESLAEIFQDIVVQTSQHEILFFLDALDECSEIRDLLDYIERLAETADNQSSVIKICCSGRPDAHIMSHLRRYPGLELHRHNTKDINQYVQDSLQKFNIRQDSETDEAKRREENDLLKVIMEHAHGVFLWAKLVLSELHGLDEEGGNFKEMQKVVLAIPKDLGQLYTHMVKKIKPEHLYEGQILLRIVLHAKRSLSLSELQTLYKLGLEAQSPLQELELQPDSTYMRRIQTRCGGLLEQISDTGGVQFIHRTVQDFIQSQEYQKYRAKHGTEPNGDLFILEGCIRSLERAVNIKDTELIRHLTKIPGVSYATQHWIYHWKEAEKLNQECTMLDKLESSNNSVISTWTDIRNSTEHQYPYYTRDV